MKTKTLYFLSCAGGSLREPFVDLQSLKNCLTTSLLKGCSHVSISLQECEVKDNNDIKKGSLKNYGKN
jgi:hypothetical protein